MKNKPYLRAGLIFGNLMAIFFVITNLIELDNPSRDQILKSVLIGLISGTVSGTLFGLFLSLFAKSKFVDKTTKIELEPGETLVHETLANHFKGMEGVGGNLYLTDKRLVFKSHKLNIQNHELSMPLSSITRIERSKTLGILNNGLLIQQNEYKPEKFVVQGGSEWIQKIIATKNGIVQVPYE